MRFEDEPPRGGAIVTTVPTDAKDASRVRISREAVGNGLKKDENPTFVARLKLSDLGVSKNENCEVGIRLNGGFCLHF